MEHVQHQQKVRLGSSSTGVFHEASAQKFPSGTRVQPLDSPRIPHLFPAVPLPGTSAPSKTQQSQINPMALTPLFSSSSMQWFPAHQPPQTHRADPGAPGRRPAEDFGTFSTLWMSPWEGPKCKPLLNTELDQSPNY